MTTVRLPVYDDEGLEVPGYAEIKLLDLMRAVNIKFVTPDEVDTAETEYVVLEFVTTYHTESFRILESLWEIAKRYGFVSVSDMCDLVGINSTFEDEKWGWRKKDIMTTKIIEVSDGYRIDFPRVISVQDLKQKV